jgi:GT2 family glycosyltransferase
MDKSPKISVVIPTKNRVQDIIKCIESIMVQTLLPDEIVIVDASDTQELRIEVRHRFTEKLKIIYIHSKPGLTHQKNVGIGVSCGDIVFFLDDDVILDKDFMKEIVRAFEKDKEKRIGGVHGNIVEVRDDKSSVNLILREIYAALNATVATAFFLDKKSKTGKFQLSGFPTYAYGINKVVRVECVPGGLTAYRREVLDEFKFDENLQGYSWGEDDDFSYRVSRKYKNVYTPDAKVIHNCSPVAKDKKSVRMKMMIENHYYLFKKNFPQTFKHKFAFCMSIIGLCLQGTLLAVTRRDIEVLEGLIAGVVSIILWPNKFGAVKVT